MVAHGSDSVRHWHARISRVGFQEWIAGVAGKVCQLLPWDRFGRWARNSGLPGTFAQEGANIGFESQVFPVVIFGLLARGLQRVFGSTISKQCRYRVVLRFDTGRRFCFVWVISLRKNFVHG